jgi:hypothetical protein
LKANAGTSNLAAGTLEPIVPKPALGRGLEKLMKAAKPPPAEDPASQPPTLSPGMAALLRRGNAPSKPPAHRHTEADSGEKSGASQTPDILPADAGTPAASGHKRVLRASLIVADVLLVGLAARMVFKSGGHFGFIETALCVVALLIGAWLACLALWLD